MRGRAPTIRTTHPTRLSDTFNVSEGRAVRSGIERGSSLGRGAVTPR
ncbi:hypothetical protein A33M_0377 [Rhodovulum sp. PH10]|nr:hypothetical protein A33M_0377 [Rhodovulum sp. PH10]